MGVFAKVFHNPDQDACRGIVSCKEDTNFRLGTSSKFLASPCEQAHSLFVSRQLFCSVFLSVSFLPESNNNLEFLNIR